MSVYITGGTLGFSLGPLLFAPFAQRFGLDVDAAARAPRAGGRRVLPPRVPPMSAHTSGGRASAHSARTRAARAPLFHRRAANPDGDRVRHVSAGDADAARDVAGGGRRVGGPVSVRERRRRVLRVGRPRTGSGPKRVIAWSLVLAAPFLLRRADAHGLAVSGRPFCHRRLLSAVDAAGQRHIRPGDGAGQRGDRVVADDGLRVGNRRAFSSGRRAALRTGSASSRRCAGLALVPLRRPRVHCRCPATRVAAPSRPADLGVPEP